MNMLKNMFFRLKEQLRTSGSLECIMISCVLTMSNSNFISYFCLQSRLVVTHLSDQFKRRLKTPVTQFVHMFFFYHFLKYYFSRNYLEHPTEGYKMDRIGTNPCPWFNKVIFNLKKWEMEKWQDKVCKKYWDGQKEKQIIMIK